MLPFKSRSIPRIHYYPESRVPSGLLHIVIFLTTSLLVRDYHGSKKFRKRHGKKCCYGEFSIEVGIPIFVPTFFHFLNLLVHPDIARIE